MSRRARQRAQARPWEDLSDCAIDWSAIEADLSSRTPDERQPPANRAPHRLLGSVLWDQATHGGPALLIQADPSGPAGRGEEEPNVVPGHGGLRDERKAAQVHMYRHGTALNAQTLTPGQQEQR